MRSCTTHISAGRSRVTVTIYTEEELTYSSLHISILNVTCCWLIWFNQPPLAPRRQLCREWPAHLCTRLSQQGSCSGRGDGVRQIRCRSSPKSTGVCRHRSTRHIPHGKARLLTWIYCHSSPLLTRPDSTLFITSYTGSHRNTHTHLINTMPATFILPCGLCFTVHRS